jgi:hypothetical protein
MICCLKYGSTGMVKKESNSQSFYIDKFVSLFKLLIEVFCLSFN